MIEIHRRADGITISGHAGYAPHGQDIVCAAIEGREAKTDYTLTNATLYF